MMTNYGAAKAALIDEMRNEIEQLRSTIQELRRRLRTENCYCAPELANNISTVQELLGRLWRDTFTGRDVG
jgi:hypothetical protein